MADYIKISPKIWDNASLPFLGPSAALAFIMLVFLASENGGTVSKDEAMQKWRRFGICDGELEGIIEALKEEKLITEPSDTVIEITDFDKIVKADQKFVQERKVHVGSNERQVVVKAWNSIGIASPSVKSVSNVNHGSMRDQMLSARIAEYGLDEMLRAVENVRNSDFLKGRNKSGWVITFDWFIRPNNFVKVLEGNYNDKESTKKPEQKARNGRFDALPYEIRIDMEKRNVIDVTTESIDYNHATRNDFAYFQQYRIT